MPLKALAPHHEALRAAAHAEPLGLYLHVPFCVDRCTYCSFTATRDLERKGAFLDRLEAEARAWGEALGHPAVDTLYVGGGTPSVLEAPELARLRASLASAFDLSPLEEATLEANPGSATPTWMAAVRACGFDRLSLGVQSLDEAVLALLGRRHDAATALQAARDARRAGFRRLSADLILGVPGQRPAAALEDAARLVEAGCSHLSLYLLDLDKACPLKAQVARGEVELPDEEAVAAAFEALQTGLPRLGLFPYEISNHAVPGEESRHNLRYWERRPYLGLGPGAASQLARWRWTESASVAAWTDGRGTPELEELDAAEALAEIPLLGLRMHAGVDWEALRARATAQGLASRVEGWEAQLRPFLQAGLLLREGSRLRLSPRGMLLSNAILQTFV